MKTLLGLIALLGVLGTALWTATAAEVPGYRTAIVELAEIRRTISATGTLQAVSTVAVGSELSGRIARLDADFNDPVRAGQPIAALDQRGFEARIVQAEAELAMAHERVAILQARLTRAKEALAETRAERAVFAARLTAARVALDAASRAAGRQKALADRGAVTGAAVEDAASTEEAANAAFREAEALAAAHTHAIASREAGVREAEAELGNARAGLPLRQAALSLARLDLERATVRAPIDGVVIGRFVEAGQTVAASLDAPVLFTIAGDLSRMEIHAVIDETDIGEIAIGQTTSFTVDAFPGHTFAAEVAEIRKAARIVQGVVTYTVVLATGNAEGRLLPGMTSLIRITVEESDALPVIPLTALGDGDTVSVLGPTGPEPRTVRLGADDGARIAVTDGLRLGEQVVTGTLPAPDRSIFGFKL